MTCEECIHFPICGILADNLPNISPFEIAKDCKYFKERSKIIYLPCKVGDKVYCLNGKGQIRQFKIRCVKTSQSDINANHKNVALILGCDNTVGLLWLESDKTKNIYFSKEEAEQALKVREKE